MGLLYVFPVSLEETDFAKTQNEKLTLKTYGLPYIFWGYATAIILIILFMFLAIKAPVLKLIHLGDETDATLGYSLLTFIGSLPVFILAYFFYEKRITRKGHELGMEYRFFGLKILSEKFELQTDDHLVVEPYISSPNIARMKGGDESGGFQNKGYYVLWLKIANGKRILIDRHSRKADLIKLRELLILKF
jgi:hypothetical protein